MKIKNTFISKITFIIVLLMFISFGLILFCIQDGHNWGDDFALYISQSQALLKGNIIDLFIQNKYSMENSTELIGPYLYPFGFPILLCPILFFFGLNFFLLKLFCASFFIASIPFIYTIFKQHLSISLSLVLIFLLSLNSNFILFSNYVLSDLPFFFFCFFTLWCFTLKQNVVQQLLLGLLIFYSYFIRDIGIVLLPTLFIYQFFSIQLSSIQLNFKKIQSFFITYTIPYFVFILFFVFTKLTLPKGGENHISILYNSFSSQLLKDNIYYYNDLLKSLLYHNLILYYILVFLFLIGFIRISKRNVHFHIFVIFYYFILLLWPSHQGIRFIFPLIPFIFYYILLGFNFLFSLLHFDKKFLHIVLISFLIIYGLFNFYQLKINYLKSDNESYTIELKKIYLFIEKNIPEKEIIVYQKPRALRLFSKRNSIYVKQKDFQSSNSNYIILSINDYKIMNYTKILLKTKNYILLKKLKP